MPQQKLYSYVVNNYPVTTTLAMSVYSFAIQKYLHCCWSNLYGFWKSRLAILLGLSQNRLCICLPRFLVRTDDPLMLEWMVSFSEAKCRFSWAAKETSGFSTNSEQTSALKRSLFACRFGSFTGGILLTKTFRLGRSFKIPFNDFTIALLAPFESFVLISLIPQCTTINLAINCTYAWKRAAPLNNRMVRSNFCFTFSLFYLFLCIINICS